MALTRSQEHAMDNERRSLPRYLCSDDFSDSQLIIDGQNFQLMSINYNRRGIALYADRPLPINNKAQITFSFKAGDVSYEIIDLNCTIRHRLEADIGNQYGIEFSNTDGKASATLTAIESILASLSDDEDRYGLDGK